MTTETPVTVSTTDDEWTIKHVGWGAIWAGLFVVLGIHILLGLLGMAVGAMQVDAPGERPSATSLGAAAMIWWTVTSIIALFIGGMIAGHQACVWSKRQGAIHGFILWGLATAVMAFALMTTMGALAGGALGAYAGDGGPARRGYFDQRVERPEAPATAEATEPLAEQERAEAAKVGKYAAFGLFLVVLLSGGAAILGGYLGSPCCCGEMRRPATTP